MEPRAFAETTRLSFDVSRSSNPEAPPEIAVAEVIGALAVQANLYVEYKVPTTLSSLILRYPGTCTLAVHRKVFQRLALKTV
jgi:hypothetical protein